MGGVRAASGRGQSSECGQNSEVGVAKARVGVATSEVGVAITAASRSPPPRFFGAKFGDFGQISTFGTNLGGCGKRRGPLQWEKRGEGWWRGDLGGILGSFGNSEGNFGISEGIFEGNFREFWVF